MRLIKSAICTIVAAGLLGGCAGYASGPNAAMPAASSQTHLVHSIYDDVRVVNYQQVLNKIFHPDKFLPDKKKKATNGIYVSEFDNTSIFGYATNNKANKGPICTISGVSYVNDMGVDGKGNLMDPDGGSGYVMLFKGPTMCGKRTTLLLDSYGQPSDAASTDSSSDIIAVSNIFDHVSGKDVPGSVTICTVASSGCGTNLTNSSIDEAAGVAVGTKGNCWSDASTLGSGGGSPALVYFKGCKGSGVVATGFKNQSFGGLDIDSKGNLVTIDANDTVVYVYSGCAPACKTVAGPLALHGTSVFGKVNSTGTEFAATDMANAAVDVYAYTGTKLTYQYSFTNGLTSSLVPLGIAFNPRSKE